GTRLRHARPAPPGARCARHRRSRAGDARWLISGSPRSRPTPRSRRVRSAATVRSAALERRARSSPGERTGGSNGGWSPFGWRAVGDRLIILAIPRPKPPDCARSADRNLPPRADFFLYGELLVSWPNT